MVDQNLGRMSLLDITSFIGVGIEVIEATVFELCAAGEGKLVNNSYITPRFVDSFTEELAQNVTDLGKVSLSDLTNRHWLPIDFIKETIASKK